jgi:hypothetical protein
MEEVALHGGHDVLAKVDFYFKDLGRSTRNFRPAAQAAPNPYYF